MKTEHNGAKNGGGMWCRRHVAKQVSRKRRRADAKRLIARELADAA